MCVVRILGLQSRFPLLLALPVYVLRPRIFCPEEHWLLVYDCFHVLIFATWAIRPDQKAKLLFLEYHSLARFHSSVFFRDSIRNRTIFFGSLQESSELAMKCKAYNPQGSQGRARNGAVIKQRDCDGKESGILFFFCSWGNPGRFVFRTGCLLALQEL